MVCNNSNPRVSRLSKGLSNVVSFFSGYVNRACRFAVEEFLARGIVKGCLTFIHEDGSSVVYGETAESARCGNRPVGVIRICNSESFYCRVATSADIGFAEAYIGGDFMASADDILNVLYVLILNRDGHDLKSSALGFSWIGRWLNVMIHMLNKNSLAGSARNIAAHYDISNEVFGSFLGETWTYSCGYFDESLTVEERTLDRAQRDKLDMIIDKARLNKDCHVLEIGCGWGEFCIRAAQQYGCRVTGISLSKEQIALGRKRVEAAGVSDLVRLELADYRVVGKEDVKYDRVVSIEMIEAVGDEYLGEYFGMIGRVLKKDGIAVLQVITTPEERYEEYLKGSDFIQKHVFPGGICPSLQAMMKAMHESGSSLIIEDIENLAVHYATTLSEWRARFYEKSLEGVIRKIGFDEKFCRKWFYYFCYCQAAFATRTLNLLQIVLSPSHNVNTLGTPPLSSMTNF